MLDVSAAIILLRNVNAPFTDMAKHALFMAETSNKQFRKEQQIGCLTSHSTHCRSFRGRLKPASRRDQA